MSKKRWGGERPMHPAQQAILALAEKEDISKLLLSDIAEKVGITGKWRRFTVSRHLRVLREGGLLPQRK